MEHAPQAPAPGEVMVVTAGGTPSARLFAITATDLWARNPPADEVESAGAGVREGTTDPGSLPAGLGGARVPLAIIRKVTADIHRKSLAIEHGGALGKKVETFNFQTFEERDLVLAALDVRLPESFKRRDVQYGVVRAAVAPVLSLAIVVLVTLFMHKAAATAANGGHVKGGSAKTRLFVWLAELLGVTGVWILCGLIMLGIVAWLVAQVRTPPLYRTITKA